jgi:hypothetical protein
MSGVYWGIVSGLVALVAVFFVCMDLLYPKAKKPLRQSDRSKEEPSESARQTPTRDRYAA